MLSGRACVQGREVWFTELKQTLKGYVLTCDSYVGMLLPVLGWGELLKNEGRISLRSTVFLK